jgi:phosphoglycerate kinase
MAAKSIADLDLQGRRVLIRVDFDVPLTPAGGVSTTARIRACLPTITHAIERGARVVLASHLGRPRGRVKSELSLMPIAAYLAEALGRDVVLADEPAGDGAKKVVYDLRDGGIAMLENLRFSPGEEANDEAFSRNLATYADVYINESFRISHRAHASIAGIAKYVSDKGMGFGTARDAAMLGKLLGEIERPFVVILGGTRVPETLSLMESLLGRADAICLGGALANTLLRAKGYDMGDSLLDSSRLPIIRAFLAKADAGRTRIVVPTDLVVTDDPKVPAGEVVPITHVRSHQYAVDIGPASIAEIASTLARARTVFWHGPMGAFENPAFAAGSIAVAKAVALVIGGTTVVAGADAASAVEHAGVAANITHISTTGDAPLEFVEGKKLPGLAALEY